MSEFYRLVEVMKKLRAPDGCPWDREQTLESLKKTLVEECYEVVEVMEEEKHEELKGELGDLLLQVVFQAEIMEEKNYFNIDDVCHEITEKLIRRHPHIFGDVSVENSEEVLVNWEEIKKKEKAHKHRESVLDGIPKTMPPLERAFKVQNKIKKFDFEPKTKEESLLRVEKTFEELKNSLDFDKEKMKKEYGKLLFSLVNLGKIMDIEPYEELRKVNKEVEEEFRKHENMYIDKNKNEK
jgi:MazG family protein